MPQENEKTVFLRMQAEREQQAKQYRAEGAEEAQKIRMRRRKDREIILAQAYKESEDFAAGAMPKRSASMRTPTGRIRSFSTLHAQWKRIRNRSTKSRRS